jgi:hypothetical protein
MDEELKPCTCGRPGQLQYLSFVDRWLVSCGGHPVIGGIKTYKKKEKAIEMWNKQGEDEE